MNGFLKMVTAASLALAVTGVGARAATVDIAFTSYAKAGLATALADRDAFIGPRVALAEDFERGFTACTGGNAGSCSAGTIVSALGTFTGIGGAHSGGGSQVAPTNEIVVKAGTGSAFGRYNVTPDGANWLDSNDREGIQWSFTGQGGPSFRKLAFLLTDLDDVGKIIFNIVVNGGAPVLRPASAPGGDGRLHLVTMTFDQRVSSFDIQMINGKGDGFGFDGARISAVPVPAAGLLLIGALGGLGALARRRKAG